MKEITCLFHPKGICPNCLSCGSCEYLKAKPLTRKQLVQVEEVNKVAERADYYQHQARIDQFLKQIERAQGLL